MLQYAMQSSILYGTPKRRIKTLLRNMGSNINPISITRAGKSVGIVHKICQVFEEAIKANKTTDYHPIPTFAKDFETILNVLKDEKVMLSTS